MKKLALALGIVALMGNAAMAQVDVQVGGGQGVQIKDASHWSDACKLSAACNTAQMQLYGQWTQACKGPAQASTALRKQADDCWTTTDKFFQQARPVTRQEKPTFYNDCFAYYETLKKMSPSNAQAKQAANDDNRNREPQQAVNMDQKDLIKVIQINGAICQALEGYKLTQFANTRAEGQKLIKQADEQIESFKTETEQVGTLYKCADQLIDNMQAHAH